MPKIIVSLDGVVIKELSLTKDRTTFGRRPYNDVVVENLAVSGEHAVFQMVGPDVYVEDLNSTNGTQVGGVSVKRHLLRHNDVVQICRHEIKFLDEAGPTGFEKTTILSPPPAMSDTAPVEHRAAIRVVSGAAAGRELVLVKVVTTIGKPGVAVASITRTPKGHEVALVEGQHHTTVNGVPMSTEPQLLQNGDVLALAGTKMQFVTL